MAADTRTKITLRLSPGALVKMDALATDYGMTRSEMLRTALAAGLPHLEAELRRRGRIKTAELSPA